jgi:hypothetical protein
VSLALARCPETQESLRLKPWLGALVSRAWRFAGLRPETSLSLLVHSRASRRFVPPGSGDDGASGWQEDMKKYLLGSYFACIFITDTLHLSVKMIFLNNRHFLYHVQQQRISTSNQTGQVFSARRKALKLSQKVVAAKLGISQNRFSILEADPRD